MILKYYRVWTWQYPLSYKNVIFIVFEGKAFKSVLLFTSYIFQKSHLNINKSPTNIMNLAQNKHNGRDDYLHIKFWISHTYREYRDNSYIVEFFSLYRHFEISISPSNTYNYGIHCVTICTVYFGILSLKLNELISPIQVNSWLTGIR